MQDIRKAWKLYTVQAIGTKALSPFARSEGLVIDRLGSEPPPAHPHYPALTNNFAGPPSGRRFFLFTDRALVGKITLLRLFRGLREAGAVRGRPDILSQC